MSYDSYDIYEAMVNGQLNELESIFYENPEFGFGIKLPYEWKGFELVRSSWEGMVIEASDYAEDIIVGGLIYIRHPKWLDTEERQDIPIMIFTLEEWALVEAEELSLGAAPMAPMELGRNLEHVFAVPARYNYAFPVGFEEVDDIIMGDNFYTFD